MDAANLLLRFDRVRKSTARRNAWTCKCPAHEDRGPSLSVAETDDGRILLHCFAGCDVVDVVAAAGLSIDDLFPPRQRAPGDLPMRRQLMPAPDALRCLEAEAIIVCECAATVAAGRSLSDGDRARLIDASANITDALRLAGVR